MAETARRRARFAAAQSRLLPRLLLLALVLFAPAALALFLLAWLNVLQVRAALVAAPLIYAAMVLLLLPLIGGIAAVHEAVEAMAADQRRMPEVESRVPAVRELWLAIGRWVRQERSRQRAREDELGAARAVFAALPEPLLLLDIRRCVVRANAAAEELLGDRLTDRDLAAGLRHPLVLAAADAVLRGEGGRTVEFELAVPVERHLSARLAPLSPHTPEGVAAVLLINDITALKRSERLRADFVANASHELRTPLATLVGFIETLRGPAREDRAAGDRFLAIMAEQAGRMTRLVDDLLSLSRIEMNEHRPPTEAVDLAGILRAVVAPLEQRAAARNMQVTLDLPESLPPVTGAADELAQVFQNLIDNAIKYGAPGTPVLVSAGRSAKLLPGMRAGQRGAAVAVLVRDHGAGIGREHLPRLTERFYRVDPARSRELGGTGLGLAIVKHIVSHHRGELEIDSELGVGSVFTVHLPAAPMS